MVLPSSRSGLQSQLVSTINFNAASSGKYPGAATRYQSKPRPHNACNGVTYIWWSSDAQQTARFRMFLVQHSQKYLTTGQQLACNCTVT